MEAYPELIRSDGPDHLTLALSATLANTGSLLQERGRGGSLQDEGEALVLREAIPKYERPQQVVLRNALM